MSSKSIIRLILKNIYKPTVIVYVLTVLFISLIGLFMPIFEAKMIDSLWNNLLNKKLFFMLTIACIILKSLFYFFLYDIFFRSKNKITQNISETILRKIITFNRKKIKEKGSDFIMNFFPASLNKLQYVQTLPEYFLFFRT